MLVHILSRSFINFNYNSINIVNPCIKRLHRYSFLMCEKKFRTISISDKKVAVKDNFKFVKVPNHSEFSITSYPKSLQPYLKLMRLHSPTGGWLLIFPGYLSLLLAASPGSFPHPSYIFFFGLGTFVMRGVGCTINDLVDRKIDAQVERTKNRPIASGQISIPKALMFLGAQSTVALYILTRFDHNT